MHVLPVSLALGIKDRGYAPLVFSARELSSKSISPEDLSITTFSKIVPLNFVV